MPEEVEVTILDRSIITTYPRLREAARTAVVTYLAPNMPARTVRIPLTELFGEKEEQAEKEIAAKKGDLYAKYIEAEDKAIQDDIRAYKAYKPEVKRITI